MKKYFCITKKWFDKINGNTYYNSKVLDNDGEVVFYTGFNYGYGSQYFYDVKEKLKKINGDDNFKLIDFGSDYTKKTILTKNNF